MTLNEFASVVDVQRFERIYLEDKEGKALLQDEMYGMTPAAFLNYIKPLALERLRVVIAKPVGSDLTVIIQDPAESAAVYETCEEFLNRIFGKGKDKNKKRFLEKVKGSYPSYDEYVILNSIKRDPAYWIQFVD